jgi:hypothetical protein
MAHFIVGVMAIMADVECAYAELKWYLVLRCNE